MYRKPSGSMGFSFQRFINNAAPSMMIDSTRDPGHISPPQKDLVFSHQTYQPPPHDARPLVPTIFFISGIIDHETVSKQVYQRLQKASVLSPEGKVDTRQIGPGFTHQLAIIPAATQKQLIDMLFWWEGECERMDRLDGAIGRCGEDLARARRDGDDEGEREAVGTQREIERLKALKPSLRIGESHLGGGIGTGAGAAAGGGVGREELPVYSERA